MAMDAVSPVGSSAAQQAQQAIAQNRAARSENPEPPPRPQPQPQAQPQRSEEQQRPPVVNLQGQPIGTIINTSA